MGMVFSKGAGGGGLARLRTPLASAAFATALLANWVLLPAGSSRATDVRGLLGGARYCARPAVDVYVVERQESGITLHSPFDHASFGDAATLVQDAPQRAIFAMHSRGFARRPIWASALVVDQHAISFSDPAGAMGPRELAQARRLIAADLAGAQLINPDVASALAQADWRRVRVRWLGAAMNAVALLSAAGLVYSVGWVSRSSPWRTGRRLSAGLCPRCRYPIQGLPGGICPECGAALTASPAAPHPPAG
jgi:hypothetical protein